MRNGMCWGGDHSNAQRAHLTCPSEIVYFMCLQISPGPGLHNARIVGMELI